MSRASTREYARPRRESAMFILVVADDPRNARVLDKLLRVDGFHVEVCADASAAARRVEQGPVPDYLVVDVSPSRAGEFAVLRRISADHPALPVIVVTAHPQLAERLAPQSPASYHVVTKPIDYPELVSLLQVPS